MSISDLIIELHNKAREIGEKDAALGFKLRLMANELAKIGNELYEKENVNEQ